MSGGGGGQTMKPALMLSARAFAFSGLAILSNAALAGPEGGQIVGGAGSIDQSGALTQVIQSSQSLAINWDSFNVGAGVVFANSGAWSIEGVYDYQWRTDSFKAHQAMIKFVVHL